MSELFRNTEQLRKKRINIEIPFVKRHGEEWGVDVTASADDDRKIRITQDDRLVVDIDCVTGDLTIHKDDDAE